MRQRLMTPPAAIATERAAQAEAAQAAAGAVAAERQRRQAGRRARGRQRDAARAVRGHAAGRARAAGALAQQALQALCGAQMVRISVSGAGWCLGWVHNKKMMERQGMGNPQR